MKFFSRKQFHPNFHFFTWFSCRVSSIIHSTAPRPNTILRFDCDLKNECLFVSNCSLFLFATIIIIMCHCRLSVWSRSLTQIEILFHLTIKKVESRASAYFIRSGKQNEKNLHQINGEKCDCITFTVFITISAVVSAMHLMWQNNRIESFQRRERKKKNRCTLVHAQATKKVEELWM